MADDKKAAAAAAVAAPINQVQVATEVSYLGARLREKNTYGGLAVALGIAAGLLHNYFPQIGSIDPNTLATALQYLGLGIGALIGIFLPEKGSPVGKINSFGMGVLVFILAVGFALVTPALAMAKSPDQAAIAAAVKHKPTRVHVAANAGSLPNIFATPTATPPLAAPSDPLASFMADLENVKAETVAGVIADIQAADKSAGTVVTPAILAQTLQDGTQIAAAPEVVRDPVSHACYPAEVKFLQSLPAFQPPTGKFIAVQLFQKKRDFMAQLKAGLPTYLTLGCVPLLGDEINTLVQSLAMVGVKLLPAGIAAICPPCAIAAAPIALPALTLTP